MQEPLPARDGEHQDEAPAHSRSASSPDPVRLRAAAIAAAVIALTGAAGSFVFMRTEAGLVLGPLAGIAAALAVSGTLDAAVAGGAGAALGFALARAFGVPGPQPLPDLVPGIAVAALAGAVAAAACALAVERAPSVRRLLPAAALALLLAGVWLAVSTLATQPAQDGSTFAGMLSQAPPIGKMTPDEALSLHVIERVRSGEDFYRATAEVLTQANAKRVGPVDLTTPLSFRLPTLYVALSLLPAGGIALVYAALALAAVASLAAYVLAERFVPPPFALLGATGVASYYAGHAFNASLLDAEVWAGALGLVSLALLVRSERSPRRSALVWSAAALALAAALVRELAVPFALVGLGAALVDQERRERREWLPWALALGATAVAYALHANAALAVIRTLADARPAGAAGLMNWIHPDGLGLLAAVDRVAGIGRLGIAVAWALTALALAGVLLAPRGSSRVALIVVVAGGLAALMVVYPSGTTGSGLPPGYWGDIVFGAVLACVPLAFAPLVAGEAES